MKKFNYLMLGLAGLALASCSQEDVVAPGAADGNFTVKVQLPGDMATRALYGQGYAAQKLMYYVYECDETGNVDPANINLVTSGETTFPENSLQTEVGFTLANGKYYQIAFFAESEQASLQDVYVINPSAASITVNYENMVFPTNNVDGYDCFYRIVPTGMIGAATTNSSPTVYLYRPVAQINWGTNDYDEKAVNNDNAFGSPSRSTIQTTFSARLYTGFNMLTSTVDGASLSEDPIEFKAMAIPSLDGYTFPVEGYEYLAMQYVLAPWNPEGNTTDGGYVYDVNINVSSTSDTGHSLNVTVDNCPVQANWRTNIYGSLLTDNFNVHVVKEPNFDGTFDIDYTTWDGKTATEPNKIGGEYQIARASDIAGLADMVNDGQDFEGETIVLNGDFDMGGNTMESLGSTNRASSAARGNSFKGVIDGKGHTISNLVIAAPTGNTQAAGFIANLDGEDAALQNINFDNLTINAPNVEQAGVVGILTHGATVSNVKVSGSVSSKEAAGGIVGRVLLNGNVTKCENNATISASSYNAGGIIGAAYYTDNSGEMTISECTNNGAVTSPTGTGGIVGLSAATVTGCTNNGKVSGSGSSVGGVVGEQKSAGKITNCVNTAEVAISNFNSGTYGTGGIVGWVRYDNAGYTRENNIEVSGCINYASVSGNTGVGGIVGTWYMSGICQNNKNYAPTLSAANQFVAGIVGDSQWTGVMPDGFTEGANLLTVTGNQSSTTQNQMTGGLKADFVYINDAAKTTQSNNQMVEPQTAP